MSRFLPRFSLVTGRLRPVGLVRATRQQLEGDTLALPASPYANGTTDARWGFIIIFPKVVLCFAHPEPLAPALISPTSASPGALSVHTFPSRVVGRFGLSQTITADLLTRLCFQRGKKSAIATLCFGDSQDLSAAPDSTILSNLDTSHWHHSLRKSYCASD